MAPFIYIRNGYMLVGHRRRDWSEVYYKPDLTNDPDEDDTSPVMLYSSTKNSAATQQPMEGEVVWISYFDVSNCESKFKRERERLQMQTLYRAWRYLHEKEPEEIEKLEKQYDTPTFVRWQAFFKLAKKCKKGHIRRRKTIENRIRIANLDPGLVDLSDLDEAYESNEEGENESVESVPVDSPQVLNAQKRSGIGDRHSGHEQASKKPKRASKARSEDSEDTGLFVSGGLGQQGDKLPDHNISLSTLNTNNEIIDIEEDHQSYPSKDFNTGASQPAPRLGGSLSKAGIGTVSDDAPQQQRYKERFSNNGLPGGDASSYGSSILHTNEVRASIAREHNGELDKDEAYNRAVRESVAPEGAASMLTPNPTNPDDHTPRMNSAGSGSADDEGES